MIQHEAGGQAPRQQTGLPEHGTSQSREQGSPLARPLERRAHLDDNDEEIWNERERAPNRNGLGRTGDR
jgi:hypothetical protein